LKLPIIGGIIAAIIVITIAAGLVIQNQNNQIQNQPVHSSQPLPLEEGTVTQLPTTETVETVESVPSQPSPSLESSSPVTVEEVAVTQEQERQDKIESVKEDSSREFTIQELSELLMLAKRHKYLEGTQYEEPDREEAAKAYEIIEQLRGTIIIINEGKVVSISQPRSLLVLKQDPMEYCCTFLVTINNDQYHRLKNELQMADDDILVLGPVNPARKFPDVGYWGFADLKVRVDDIRIPEPIESYGKRIDTPSQPMMKLTLIEVLNTQIVW